MVIKTSPSSQKKYSSDEEVSVQTFAKHMLQGHVFRGNFVERKYIDNLSDYRTAIIINRNEKEVINNLKTTINRVRGYYDSMKFLGFTQPEERQSPSGYVLYVNEFYGEMSTYGEYWFLLQGMRFKSHEIYARLKVIRPVCDNSSIPDSAPREDFNLDEVIEEIKSNFERNMKKFTFNLYRLLTIENAKQVFIFISILIVTFFTGSVKLFVFFTEFLLKFMREASRMVESCTPIVLGLIAMFEKIIGGFYILIAMMWRGTNVNTGGRSRQTQYAIRC